MIRLTMAGGRAYTAEHCVCGQHWRLLRVVDLVLAFRAGRR